MPSQEIHLFTINQGTQMPSQQWEQSPTPEDHDPTQTEATMVFTIASQDTSHKSEIYRATHTGVPTHSPTPKIDTTNTIESHPDKGIHLKTASIREDHSPTLNLTSDTGTDKDSDNQNNKGTTDSKVMNPQPSGQIHIRSDKQFPKHSAVQDKLQLTPDTTTDKDNPNRDKEHPRPRTVKERINPHVIHTDTQANKLQPLIQSTSKQSCQTTITNASPGQNSTNNSDPEITILKQGRTHGSPHLLPGNTTTKITTDKGNPNMDEKHPHPRTNKEKINPHLIHTDTKADKQELPMQSTSKQSYQTLITDASPGRSSTENSGPAITILEQESTHKPPRAHPSNTQIIIGRKESSNTDTVSHNTHAPTITTITSSEDSSDDGVKEITIQDKNSTGTHPHRGQTTGVQISKATGNATIRTSQDTDTANKWDQSTHQEILENKNPTKTPSRIRITTQNSAKITIVPQRPNITQQDNTANPTQPKQEASKNRDLNNNVQANVETNTPIQCPNSNTPTVSTKTCSTCDGTIYRLTPMGKSNRPIHQTGPCHTHPRDDNRDPQRDTENSGWELAQTKHPKGVNNFKQDSNGKLTTTGLG